LYLYEDSLEKASYELPESFFGIRFAGKITLIWGENKSISGGRNEKNPGIQLDPDLLLLHRAGRKDRGDIVKRIFF
jgi:hypothetical protein